VTRRFPHLTAQAYYVGLALLNTVHRLLPFTLRPLLYRLAGYDIDRSATLQGGVRFFHVGRLRVGEGTLINRGVYLDNRAGLTIGRQVSIAHDSKIYTLGHDVEDPQFGTKGRPVAIGDYAVVFANALIMPGVTLGEGAVVLAGAVVTKSVPAFAIVGGNPAREVGERELRPSYRLQRRYWFAH
jgi:acetyltransferase-like isoleucine patch superfamily enzyme